MTPTPDLIARLRWHSDAVADDVFQADHELYAEASDALETLMKVSADLADAARQFAEQDSRSAPHAILRRRLAAFRAAFPEVG